MKLINRLCIFVIVCNCIALKLCGQECQFALVEYSVPTSWTELPDPNTSMTIITVIGCVLESKDSILILKMFVNGVPKEMVAVPKGSITKSVMLQTVAPDPNKLPSTFPTVRVNETLQNRRTSETPKLH